MQDILIYKVFMDVTNGMLLEQGETYDTLAKVTKELKEKYYPYKVRREVFPMCPNAYVFFVNPNKEAV